MTKVITECEKFMVMTRKPFYLILERFWPSFLFAHTHTYIYISTIFSSVSSVGSDERKKEFKTQNLLPLINSSLDTEVHGRWTDGFAGRLAFM